MADFLSLGVSKQITKQLQQNGITIPTPIQEKTIPLVLNGHDVISQAQTGTGKTFAFILPILEKVNTDASAIQGLIVTPTRELALQITSEIEKLIPRLDGVGVLAVYGGQDVEKQLKKLQRNPAVVVGTPGRLLDHIRRETLDLSGLSFLVLDEADQMLHIGFLDEVEKIIKETPSDRQTLLFSATMPVEVQQLARRYMREPKYIQVAKQQGPAENVKQIGIHTTDRAKQATLIQLVETYRPFLAVIFCRTKRRVTKLYDALKANGFSCDELHGDLSQAKREQVMKRFRDAEIQLLIATDVAARGLDVEGVTHVFNYDIPQDSESFIHRIGRTGRAGMKGLAITLYSSADRPKLDMIEEELNIRIEKQNFGNVEAAKENKEKAKSNIPQRQQGQGEKGERQNRQKRGAQTFKAKPERKSRDAGFSKKGKPSNIHSKGKSEGKFNSKSKRSASGAKTNIRKGKGD